MTYVKSLRAFLSNRSGAMGVMFGMFLAVSVGLCALVIDVGSLYLERRTAQGAADLAAIAAAGDLDRAEDAARATLRANGFGDIRTLNVVKGRYEVDRAVGHGLRFSAGKQPHNAVRLSVAFPGQVYFAKALLPTPEIAVTALGAADGQAMFSIGSRLASLRGGIVNALLGGLLGSSINISVMDYDALLRAEISLSDFLSSLALEIGITAGTYEHVVNAQATVGEVLRAAAHASRTTGQVQAAQALATLAAQSPASAVVPLGAIVDIGSLANAAFGQPSAGLSAKVDVMSLVTAAATAANGERQISVNLGAAVPGLLGLTLDMAIGERAQHSGWVAVGQAGATLRTAQTRVRLLAEVGGSGLLAGLRVRLPVYIELASAEARLESLQCTGGQQGGQAVIAARPSAVKAWIGDINLAGMPSFGTGLPVSPAALVKTPLLSITAASYAEMGNVQSVPLTFTRRDVDDKVIKTAEVRDFVGSITAHLLQTADVRVSLIGLGSLAAIKGAVLGLLTPVASALDPVLASVLDLVGVHLGEVDVRVHGVRCGNAVLAG